MEETKAWLEHDALGLATALEVNRNSRLGAQMLVTTKVTSISLIDCVLSYTTATDMAGRLSRSTHSVPLKLVELNAIRIKPHATETNSIGWTSEGNFVTLSIEAKTGQQFGYTESGQAGQTRVASMRVRDSASAERIINALRQAAKLCGNVPSPF